MKLGGTWMAGMAPAPMGAGGWRKATALARASIVAGIALGCGLACDSGSASTAGGQPPASVPARTPASASSQAPQAPASGGQVAGTSTKSQYLSNLHNVANSGATMSPTGAVPGCWAEGRPGGRRALPGRERGGGDEGLHRG